MANTGRNDPCPCGSGRKYKRCCMRKRDRSGFEMKTKDGDLRVSGVSFASADYHPDDDDATFRAVFLGEGSEELTDAVIAELVERGWPEKDLRTFQVQGAHYNRVRDSLILPGKEW